MRYYLTLLMAALLSAGISAQGPCPPPSGSFTYTIAPDGVTVTFTSEANCTPNPVFSWSFGDGASSSAQSPQHTYSGDGYYLVTFRITMNDAPCTIQNNSNLYYQETQTIHIQSANPGILWAELTGPTLAAECQQITYNVSVTGGVPPYTYEWDPGSAWSPDCPSVCTGDCGPFINNEPQLTGTYASTGFTTNTVFVKVTDGLGQTEIKSLATTIKAGLQPLEFFVNGASPPTCGNAYSVGTLLLLSPNIQPLSAFSFPVTYVWNMGDGTIITDNSYGNQGIVTHTYQPQTGIGYPHTYTVTLTVSDENGSMQASKNVTICDPNANPGGGGGGPESFKCLVGLDFGQDFVIVEYGHADFDVAASIQQSVESPAPPICFQNNTFTWIFTMDDCNLGIFDTEDDMPQNGASYEIDLVNPNSKWDILTQGLKPWGNVYVKYNRHLPNDINNVCCQSPQKKLFYIKPPPFKIEGITVEGDCQDFVFTANVVGGAWKLDANHNKYYKSDYVWKARNSITNEEISDLFLPMTPGGPMNTQQIRINPAYYANFTADQYVEFLIEVIAYDYASQEASTTELVTFNPFRIHLHDKYYRCPGVTSTFDNDFPLATGGSGGPYTYSWSSPALQGERPEFVAPAAGGSNVYTVTVTDGNCTFTASTTVYAQPLTLTMESEIKTCEVNANKKIGPPDIASIGGSGTFMYEWTPSDWLNKPQSMNPTVTGLPVGTTITYTLKVTDLYGGCTATAAVKVTSVPNTVSATLPQTINVCYGEPLSLICNQYDWTQGYSCTWEYPTFPRKDLIVSDVDGHSIHVRPPGTSYPGTYSFKARVTQERSGCYAEAITNVTIREQWKHQGYEPLVLSTTVGSEVTLWGQTYGSGTCVNMVTTNPVINNPEIEWNGGLPTSVSNCNYIPSKGYFKPTVEHPFLEMRVSDPNTGCYQTFVTNKYILSTAKPELWATTDGYAFCAGKPICVEIHFDPHLAGLPPVYIPLKVKVDLGLYQSAVAGHTSLQCELHLNSSSGVYSGKICLPNLTFSPFMWLESYSLVSEVGPNNSYMPPANWTPSNFKLNFTIGPNLPLAETNYYGCLDPFDNSIVGHNRDMVTVGVNCNPNYPTYIYSGRAVAKTRITISNEAQVKLEPQGTGGSQHLFINPCIGESNLVEIPDREEQIDEVQLPQLSGNWDFELAPNPFHTELNILFRFDSVMPQSIDLELYDMTGRKIEIVRHWADLPAGSYTEKLHTEHLQPGLYTYILRFSSGKVISKQTIKI